MLSTAKGEPHAVRLDRLGVSPGGLVTLSARGEIRNEGVVPADEDGLAKLVLALGTDVTACVEMMSGAVWSETGCGPRAGRSRSPMLAKSKRLS